MSTSPSLSTLPQDLQARVISYLPLHDYIAVRHLNHHYNTLTCTHTLFNNVFDLLVVYSPSELREMRQIQQRKGLFKGFLLVSQSALSAIRPGSRTLHCVRHLRIDDYCSLQAIIDLYTHDLLSRVSVITAIINAANSAATAAQSNATTLQFLALSKQRCRQLNVRFVSERQDYDISWLQQMNICVQTLTTADSVTASPMHILSCIGVPIEAAPLLCSITHLTALQLYTQSFELDRMLNRQHVEYTSAANHSIDLAAISQLVNLRVLTFRVFESRDRQALNVRSLMEALANMSLQMLAISVYPCDTATLLHDMAPLAQPNSRLHQSCQSLQLNMRPLQGNDAGWDVADACDLEPSASNLCVDGLKHFTQLQHLAIPFKLLLESQAVIHLQQLQSLTFCQLADRPAYQQQCQYVNDQRTVMGLAAIEHFAEGWPEDKWWQRYTGQMLQKQR